MADRRNFQFDFERDFPHLRNPPIVEAVIEWQARAKDEVNEEHLKGQLIDALPDYPTYKTQQEFRLESRLGREGATTEFSRESWQGFRYESGAARQIAQFRKNGFMFSRLCPYHNWQQFSSEALRLWQLFLTLAEPTEIRRLGVRFVNRISLQRTKESEKYLARLPKSLEPTGLHAKDLLYQPELFMTLAL